MLHQHEQLKECLRKVFGLAPAEDIVKEAFWHKMRIAIKRKYMVRFKFEKIGKLKITVNITKFKIYLNCHWFKKPYSTKINLYEI